MPRTIRFPEWRDEQEYPAYPFEDESSLTTTTGETFPASTFIDAAVYILDVTKPIQLTAVTVAAELLTLTFGTEDELTLATAEFEWTSADTQLQLQDTSGRACGVLVSDAARLSVFQGWGAGDFTMESSAAVLVAACQHPIPDAGVTSFELDDGSVLFGDVYIVGDNGIVLNCVPTTHGDACGVLPTPRYAIQVNAIGDPLFLRKVCEPTLFQTATFLQSLVFQKGEKEVELGPGEDGRIIIWQGSVVSENTILRVVQRENKLKISVVGEKL